MSEFIASTYSNLISNQSNKFPSQFPQNFFTRYIVIHCTLMIHIGNKFERNEEILFNYNPVYFSPICLQIHHTTGNADGELVRGFREGKRARNDTRLFGR
jgi:hypothetical protein